MKSHNGFLPNLHTSLKLVRARLEGEGQFRRVVEETFKVVGFEVLDGKCLPVTPTGSFAPEDGYLYALLDTDDKNYFDLLTRVQYSSYKEWVAPLWAAQSNQD
ncbi:hypothetical protein QTI24_26610 [Variovorax sp. J22P240]|uniref:hypothetical protein n=1 Tax=Variovorax sp. J22P240 TaxID=3053514 RepID=UPI002577755F|nr:hypothetical protein [Variovorax sp. J22P240]MDM0002205.1 hypothetical protein [Variovorax sp. J22P240]